MNINEIYNVIGDNIRRYRINNLKYGYLTQEKLSRISLVSLSQIRNIEAKRKKSGISLLVLNNLANSLDIPLYKIFMKE